MHTVVLLVGIVAVVVAVAAVCAKLDLPSPLVLILVGVVGSYLPFVPDVTLEPEVVLFGLLPPLLYAAALQTSLVDFNANRRPILLLSVGLVILTTFGVGAVVHALLPGVGWAAALAIGAVVAPPDAVAATSIGRRIGLPRRVVTILEGESLLNDATALVALNTAIAAIVSWQVVGADFAIAAFGGVAVGLAFYVVIGFARKHVTQTTLDTALGLLTPFAAFVAAEEIGVPTSEDHVAHPSGVVAVVVAGLLLGHRSAVLQNAQSRIAERLNWRSIQFLLESAVFLLIGLQARDIIANAFGDEAGTTRVLVLCVATLVTVVAIRMAWVFFSRYALVRPGPDGSGKVPPWTYTFLLGWAGMRGVVTLAAAFIIPPETPFRDVLLLIAFFVTAGTLLLQGASLPWVARRLRVPSPDPAADALLRANVLHQASQAGLGRLDELAGEDPHDVATTIRDRVQRRDFAAWERVGPQGAENPSETYNRWRREMIDVERGRVLEIRSTGTVPHEVIDEVLAMLDVEESMLDHSSAERERVRGADATAFEGDCEHLRQVRAPVEPDSAGECTDCLREGTTWVHLRMCVVCGHIACCDSSPQRHASVHHEHTGHEVMRSAEPGEDWRWCFVDQVTG
ncbi:sodium:proton antiporter [Marmoricola sp. Leaf446]|uniref:cation:proton antiporter domain-containing protein n=1 Tax=Marmoricola sp. Leaf446 TaxID=1736379 RepID=UPI0006FBD788|nr:cation:proton antiporter [Marmoricola sp. Leaf446]KQT93646.1 sodium:proton antiporter [Marmoricola sp. Leaf446]